MDLFVVVMSPNMSGPIAVYGPFEDKHKAYMFIEDKIKQDEYLPESKKRAFVVRSYGVPDDPVFKMG